MPPSLCGRVDTVFLDRDGTINVKAPEGFYVEHPDDLTLLPGAASSIARLNAADMTVILVTNQRWLSRPDADPDAFAAIQARLDELLGRAGARLDAAYHCPHARGVCRCRKPDAGMLQQAARDLGVDLRASAIVGDAPSDLAAGRAVGTCTVLLDIELSPHPLADVVVVDLQDAVDLLLGIRKDCPAHEGATHPTPRGGADRARTPGGRARILRPHVLS